MQARQWRTAIFISPLILLGFFAYMKIFQTVVYVQIIREDHILENIQFFVYIATAAIALSFCGKLWRIPRRGLSSLYCIAGMAMLFVAMEEISWGHTPLNLELPTYFQEHNTQGDLTLHNLDSVQPMVHLSYIALGLVAAFGQLLLSSKSKARMGRDLDLLLPNPILCLFFFPVALLYLHITFFSPWVVEQFGWTALDVKWDMRDTFIVFKDQEPAELLLGLGLLLFVSINRFKPGLLNSETQP